MTHSVFPVRSAQTFNALVNYTNRNASSPLSQAQLLSAYAAATCSGVSIGVILNQVVAKTPAIAGGLVARCVLCWCAFVAVVGLSQARNLNDLVILFRSTSGQILYTCGTSSRAILIAQRETFFCPS